jgi:hypothetical protein
MGGGNWNLGDPSVFQGLPMPASPVSSSGQDPDELREMMAARAAQQGTQLGARMAQQNPVMQKSAAGSQPPVPASAQAAGAMGGAGGPATEFEPAGVNADAARQAMMGELSSGRKLDDTADQMQPDPAIAQLQQKKVADEAAAPNPSDYKPGIGTRVLRGLKGAALGLAEHGLPGAAVGAISPSLVAGGTAYGAPTDAYDVALNKNKQQVTGDTEALTNATTNFKQAQDLRAAREKALTEGDTAYKGAGTTATAQEGQENDATKNATDAQRVFNEGPGGKLELNQGQIDQRTRQADNMKMPPGYMRTRFILTGDMQPGREPTADEVAVNQILGTYRQQHGGKGPQTVSDWQEVYAAAKGGTAANAGGNGAGGGSGAGLTGESYLATLPPATAATVRAIGEGREAPPNAGNRSAAAQQLLAAVNQAYPGYDATSFPTYKATREKFTSGPIGVAINSFNTAIEHLGRLEQNIPQENTGFSMVNRVGAALSPSGSQRSIDLGKWDTDANAVSNEVQKAYKGGEVNKEEYEHMLGLLDRNAAPAKMQSNIQELRGLLQGKLASYKQQWQSAMPQGAVSPLDTIGGGSQPAPGGAAPAGVSTDPRWKNLPDAH